jgi:hypothetical protein
MPLLLTNVAIVPISLLTLSLSYTNLTLVPPFIS